MFTIQFSKFRFHTYIILLLLIISCSESNQKDVELIKEKINFDKYGFAIDSFKVYEGQIKKNETLADILVKFNIEYQLITDIFEESKSKFDFRKIRPQKKYAVYFNQDSSNSFYGFVYELNKVNYLKIELKDSLAIEFVVREVTVKEKTITGTINSSLYQTLIDQKSSAILAGKLAEVFAWQIDFYTIQKGDKFYAVYEEKFVQDEYVKTGDILAAKFIHRGNPYTAFLFKQNNGKEYFDEEGKSLQKEFLKAPLKFKRISSHYTRRRLHPILRVYKPHRGIDYAAAIGTPVQAVGDGIVQQVLRKGAAGNMVKIKHNGMYSSAYLHLSGYGKGIRSGVKVTQGQVIGYVGSTGRSTGPHLDFRFWKNGSLVNYLTQKFPSSNAIFDSNQAMFSQIKDSLSIKLSPIQNHKTN